MAWQKSTEANGGNDEEAYRRPAARVKIRIGPPVTVIEVQASIQSARGEANAESCVTSAANQFT